MKIENKILLIILMFFTFLGILMGIVFEWFSDNYFTYTILLNKEVAKNYNIVKECNTGYILDENGKMYYFADDNRKFIDVVR